MTEREAIKLAIDAMTEHQGYDEDNPGVGCRWCGSYADYERCASGPEEGSYKVPLKALPIVHADDCVLMVIKAAYEEGPRKFCEHGADITTDYCRTCEQLT